MFLVTPILAALTQASVSMTFTPPVQCAAVNDIVEVELVLATDVPTAISAVDVILSWNPAQLDFLNALPGGATWFVTGFFNDPDGINTSLSDGNALYTLLGNPLTPPTLPPNIPAAKFRFRVLADAQVAMLPTLGAFGKTKVLGTTPGSDLTGAISGPVLISAVSGPAIETPRLGSPPNPFAFKPGLTSGPVIGQVWDPYIDHSAFVPTAVLDAFGVTFAPINIALPPFGTLLCLPPTVTSLYTSVPGLPFHAPIPADCVLVGASLCTQAFSIDGASNLLLTNALDITLGSF